MPDKPIDPTLTEQFSKVSRSALSRPEAASWDPGLSRDPALLVPVDVQALYVRQGEAVEHADFASAFLGRRDRSEIAGDGSPPPFTDLPNRPPGVYLHWALPDGLTAGHAEPGGELQLPPLPNRWLVVRLDSGDSDARKRKLAGWVVESESGFVDKLQGWREGKGKADTTIAPSRLTAAVGGDLGWTAIFDSARNRFAFYDDLKGPAPKSARLSYLVVGWYSDPELDPLHPTATDESFDELMRRLGWTVDEARLEAARQEAERRRQAVVDTLRVDAQPLTVAGIDTQLPSGGGKVDVPATELSPPLLETAEAIDVKAAPWRPQRSIYHGVVYGVGAQLAGRGDPRPSAADLKLAVGQSAQESLARMLADALGGDEAASERLQTAFGYDLVDAFDAVDGVPRIEEEIHLRGFGALPGERYTERVKAGDALEQVHAAEAPPPEGKDKRRPNEGEDGRRRVEFGRKRHEEVLDEFSRSTRPDTFDPPPDPYRTIEVERAGARWHFPVDPVVMVQGLGRSLRHGFDGRFDQERLACRLSGDAVRSVSGLVKGEQLLENRIDHGGVPFESAELLAEAVLEDPFSVDDVAAVAASVSGQQADRVRRRMRGERALHLRLQEAGSDAPRLTAASLKEGVEASPLAVTVWRQPWVPLCLEWKLELALDAKVDPARWTLGELDYELVPSTASPASTLTVTGRSLLNATAAKLYADQVNRFLEQEDRLDAAGQGGVIQEGTEGQLRATATQAEFVDVMSAAFDGLREKLLGFDTNLAWEDASGVATLAPARVPVLLRAGTAKLTRARVVDAFGRRLDIDATLLAQLLVAEPLRPPQDAAVPAGTVLMAPRITQPSRLHFRLLDHEDDGAEATIDQAAGPRSPIAGWLLPDHADAALEFFDATGAPAGQLRHEAIGGGVTWESAPGTQAAFGEAPAASLTSRHTAAMATALVQRDAADRAGAVARSESPLAALLRVIDTTLWTVDPFGSAGNEHLSMLVGRPIAVVRAELRLEVDNDVDRYGLDAQARAARQAAFEELARQVLDVRLGSLARFGDGLLGYFLQDDYHLFHPVHASVLQSALPSGPHTGYLGTQADRAGALEPVPIEQPYVEPDPTVSLRPGQTVRLTLLMDPGAAVHATSGLLPRKSVSLARDWIAGPLQRISPSFRAGPLLLGPQAIQMPKANVLAQDQLWSRRETPVAWRDDPILAATNEAALPEQSPVAQEGYIRARPE